MWNNINLQGLVITPEDVKLAVGWSIAIGTSIASFIIAIKRNKYQDHKKEHDEIKSTIKENRKECEAKIHEMESSINVRITEQEARNTRSHAEIRSELHRSTDQLTELVRQVAANVNAILNKMK
jgi:hypothetical protein